MNAQTYFVFFSYPQGEADRDTRHAQIIMREAAETGGFKIVSSAPQSIADGWEFTIESPERPTLPAGCRYLSTPMIDAALAEKA